MLTKLHHPSTFIVCGPSGCGKTVFTCNFLHNLHMFDTEINKVHWYNTEIAALPKKENLPENLEIEYFNKLPDSFENDPNEPLIVILDDVMSEINANNATSQLFSKKAHHNSITALFLTQNCFHSGKHTRDISLNASYMVLFKTIRGKSQMNTLFQQMYPENWKQLQKIYKDVTRKPHTYLFIDLTQNTPDLLRFRTDIFDKHITCYCPADLLNNENGAVTETVKGKQIFALHST